MTNPQPIFDALDRHAVAVFALCGLAMIGNYIWFFGALKVAKRDRTYPIPIFLTFFWFAHDSSFVGRYNTWFHTYHHWFPRLFWALIIFTVIFEIAFIVQTLKYAHQELAPSLSVWRYRTLILGGCASMIIAWTWLKQSMDDPIYLDIFALTVMSYPGLAIMTLLRRGDRRGMSMQMCAGFLMMTVCYFTASTFLFGPHFQTVTYVLVGLASLGMGLAMTWLTWKAPEHNPATSAAAGGARVPAAPLGATGGS